MSLYDTYLQEKSVQGGSTGILSKPKPSGSLYDQYLATKQQEEPFAKKFSETLPGTTQGLADLQIDPFSLKADPKKAVGDAWESIKGALETEKDNIVNLFKAYQPGKSTAERSGAGLKAFAGAAGVAFSPITALFAAGKNIPVLGSAVRLIELPFSAVGESGAKVGSEIVDRLPVPEDAKEKLRPGVEEIFALAGQILLGKASEVGFKKYLPSSKEAIALKTKIAQENPEIAPKIEEIAPSKVSSLIKRYGEEDAMTVIKKSIELAENKDKVMTPQMQADIAEAQANGVTSFEGYTKFLEQKAPPIEGTGDVKTRGLSLGVEAKAIENKLVKDFGELPQYQAVNMAEQATKALDLINKDAELGRRIAMGEAPPPTGIIPEAVFNAFEERAIKNSDINTLRELATNSHLVEEATTMGQRIRTLAERDPDSAVKAMTDVLKTRESSVKDFRKAKKEGTTAIKNEIKKLRPTKQTWSEFVDSLTC